MGQRSIDHYSRFLKKGIPVITVAGMLFFVVPVQCAASELAVQLFQESEWLQCHRECLRVLAEGGGESGEAVMLLDALALLEIPARTDAGTEQLAWLASEASSDRVRCSAAYHGGLVAWQEGRVEEGWRLLRQAFLGAQEPGLFCRAGCALAMRVGAGGDDIPDDPGLMMQLRTVVHLWTRDIVAECRPGQQVAGEDPVAARWFIAFYRSQISPAIGSRCAMDPSCSEYFLQASQKHGVLGVPMVADRLVRESTVHAQGASPVVKNGKVRYRDPLSAHDFWMAK